LLHLKRLIFKLFETIIKDNPNSELIGDLIYQKCKNLIKERMEIHETTITNPYQFK